MCWIWGQGGHLPASDSRGGGDLLCPVTIRPGVDVSLGVSHSLWSKFHLISTLILVPRLLNIQFTAPVLCLPLTT